MNLDTPLTRREFIGMLEMVGMSVMVVAVGGSIRRSDQEFTFSRPPGARDEDLFLALCLRCDKCREACPYRVIRPVRLTESLINAGTPILDGSCRQCMRCRPVCPTGALI
jgi:ferredoxin-type protein NapG